MAQQGLVLLVLDMQNDIVKGAFSHEEQRDNIDKVIETIRGLTTWARTSGVPIVYSRVAFRPSYVDTLTFPLYAVQYMKEGHLLEDGTPGADIIDELTPQPGDIVVVKRRVGVFYGTDLEVVLRGLGARTLLYTGTSTARVVESTVREAHSRDFTSVVISDGCFATKEELHRNALASIADWFGQVMPAQEAMQQFG